jgi:hypothetical protein
MKFGASRRRNRAAAAAFQEVPMNGYPSLGINLVQLVTIPTNDQSRSLELYQSLGFEGLC